MYLSRWGVENVVKYVDLDRRALNTVAKYLGRYRWAFKDSVTYVCLSRFKIL